MQLTLNPLYKALHSLWHIKTLKNMVCKKDMFLRQKILHFLLNLDWQSKDLKVNMQKLSMFIKDQFYMGTKGMEMSCFREWKIINNRNMPWRKRKFLLTLKLLDFWVYLLIKYWVIGESEKPEINLKQSHQILGMKMFISWNTFSIFNL